MYLSWSEISLNIQSILKIDFWAKKLQFAEGIIHKWRHESGPQAETWSVERGKSEKAGTFSAFFIVDVLFCLGVAADIVYVKVRLVRTCFSYLEGVCVCLYRD